MKMTEKEKDWWRCLGGLDYLVKYGGYAIVEEDYPYTLDHLDKWKVAKEKEIGAKIAIVFGPGITLDSYQRCDNLHNAVKIRYSYWRNGSNA